MRRPAKNEVRPLVLVIVLQAVLFQQHCAIFGDREKANYPLKAELESTLRKKRRKPPKMSEWAASNKSTVIVRQEKAAAGSDRASFVVEASDVRLIPGCRRKELPLGPQGPATNSRGKEHAHRRAKRTKNGPRLASGAFRVLP